MSHLCMDDRPGFVDARAIQDTPVTTATHEPVRKEIPGPTLQRAQTPSAQCRKNAPTEVAATATTGGANVTQASQGLLVSVCRCAAQIAMATASVCLCERWVLPRTTTT